MNNIHYLFFRATVHNRLIIALRMRYLMSETFGADAFTFDRHIIFQVLPWLKYHHLINLFISQLQAHINGFYWPPYTKYIMVKKSNGDMVATDERKEMTL